MQGDALRAVMLDELMAALGSGNKVTAQRLEKIEDALRPIVVALPKNEHGNLEHDAVRYAMHRLFVLRHGMYIKGLEPGEAWNGSSSPTEILNDKVPTYVQSLFEQRLSGQGLGLHEIAILAATWEHLIHDEARERLRLAYDLHQRSVESLLTQEMAERVVDTYMVMFLVGNPMSENISTMSFDDVKRWEADIMEIYPAWPESQKFTRNVQRSFITTAGPASALKDGMLSFNATLQLIEEISDRYGNWQDYECRDLKATLIKMEDPGTGRVPLKRFYGSGLDGTWQFTESEGYLQALGIIDETDPMRRSVMIPNYMYSPANCLTSSSIYSLCCQNECEALLGHLEREVAEPDATIHQIIDLVGNLPSATVSAPRAITAELRALLEEVASNHRGLVPLHSRLFGQWMHHAYPRECPYPHKAGTVKYTSMYDWVGEKGIDALTASSQDMEQHSAHPTSVNETTAQPARMMWTTEEELVASTTLPPSPKRWYFFGGVTMAAFMSVCAALVRSLGPMVAVGLHGKNMLPMAQKAHYC